jgi:hypothetical protein
MRGDLTRQPPSQKRWEPFTNAQSKLYGVMKLEQPFLEIRPIERHFAANLLRHRFPMPRGKLFPRTDDPPRREA